MSDRQGSIDFDRPRELPDPLPRFDGAGYERSRDHARLSGQALRVFGLMRDRRWRTLPQIAAATGDPEASISAQLRHLRKLRFGEHGVEKRHRGDPAAGLWEYQLTVNPHGFGADVDPGHSSPAPVRPPLDPLSDPPCVEDLDGER